VKMIGHLMAGRIPSLVWEIQIVCNSCQLCECVCCSCSWRLFNWIPWPMERDRHSLKMFVYQLWTWGFIYLPLDTQFTHQPNKI